MLRRLLTSLANNKRLSRWVTERNQLMRVARRFVAGNTLAEAIRAVQECNAKGIGAILNYLGEEVREEGEAARATASYLRSLDAIGASRVDSTLSVKLTQLGLDISESLCLRNLEMILMKARDHKDFVTIDMENSAYTEPTLGLFRSLRQRFDNVGVCIQSYLYRSEEDVKALVPLRARVRLCKGAYAEPKEVAYPEKSQVDESFTRLSEMLLDGRAFAGIATHDERMIQHARGYASAHGIGKGEFEFQLLYGVRRDLQRALRAEGFNVRAYIPYGSDWFPYLMRRLAERPANLLFVLRSLLREP